MQRTLAPLRISLIGGGTDYEKFYKYFNGRVINLTCNKYVEISIGSFSEIEKLDSKRRILINNVGLEVFSNLSSFEEPYLRHVIKHFMPVNIGIACDSDIPLDGMGLGWSGSFVVALIFALISFEGRRWGEKDIVRDAYKFEHEIMGEPGGKQDHCAAAWGGFNFFEFDENGSVLRKSIKMEKSRLNDFLSYLMLFDSGIRESPGKVLREQQSKIPSCFRQLRTLSDMVLEFHCELEQGSFESCGRLLHEAWHLKKQFSNSVSNDKIDASYDRAIRAGALGGKIMGPGGGGLLLLMVKPENQEKVYSELAGLRKMSFDFEPSGVRSG